MLKPSCSPLRRLAGPLTLTACLYAAASMAQAAEFEPADIEFFERRIRPVLVEHCYECHAGSAKKVQGGLRLDSRAAARTGGESGPAVVPGDVEASLIVSALRHDAFEMPPGKKLPEAIAADFEQWIRRGAADPRDSADAVVSVDHQAAAKQHWAFQPVRSPEPPSVQHAEQALSPIDRFVLARLEPHGLRLSPAADRETLVRRATFDLTGLPPTPAEVDAFVADDSPRAFARLVDRLLDSPRYGEHWGRHWLDVARYADNKGYVFFEEKRFPWAWTYRDYVVRAFNEDLPYDRFALQQLAADRLVAAERPAGSSAVEGGDRRALAAMGFLTLGARFMNNTHDVLDDRIDVVTRGLLGLTVTCARCHDHKYDPVSQDDYYALYGVFRSSVEPILPPEFLPSPETDEYRQFQAGMDERLARLSDFIDAQREQIIAGSRKRAGEYLLAVHERRNHPDTENFMLLTDKGGLNPAMIKRWEVYLKRSRRSPDDPIWSVWHAFAALPDDGFAEQAKGTHATLFGDQRPADAAPINSLVREAFAEAPPLSMREVAERYGEALGLVDEQWDRIAAASQPGEPRFDDAAALREVLYGENSPPMIPRELAWGFLDLLPDRPTQDEYKKLLKEVETWSMNQPGAPPRAMTLVDARTPYDPVVFVRGNPNREGESVERRFLTLLSEPNEPPFSHGSGRLELARKIVDPSNPLTARVMVNRVWMHHFGRGLVTTASDFGLRSETPSHPELLDWLATRFVEEGWSVKQLHRLIMNSAVYQQAGLDVNRAAARGDEDDAGQIRRTVDPENRLLSFFPQRRLSFEMLRDSLLSVAGSLDDRVGGPPTNVLGGFNSRRTIYGFIDRMDLPGLMRAFDFPDPASSSPGRERTTIAPQALFFMNDPFVAEAARRLAARPDVRSIATDEQRVEHVYRLLFARSPDADELSAAKAYLASSSDGESGDSAWKYGYGRVDEDKQRVAGFTELTHWTGTRWQASGQLPDPKLGWVFLDRQGGHPAATIERCAIRRWTAPVDGEVEIAGQLHHRPEPGNGIRARLVSSRHGVLGTWSAHHTSVDTGPVRTRVAAGDTIDFVVDFNGEILHDEHEWPVVIRHVAESPPNDAMAMWDSVQDFRGGRVDRWQAFLHALLMTNEFVFVD